MKRGDKVSVVGVVSQVYTEGSGRGIVVAFPLAPWRGTSWSSGARMDKANGTVVKGLEVDPAAVFAMED